MKLQGAVIGGAELAKRPRMTIEAHQAAALYAARCASTAGERAAALADALMRGEYNALDDALADAGGYLEAAVSLVQPAMYVVGEQWAKGAVSTAREHLATALAQTHLARAFPHQQCLPRHSRRVVCACVAGNRHALGLRLVADAFELAGWNSFHLGSDVPRADLIQFVAQNSPDVVALSICGAADIESAGMLIAALRHELGPRRPHVLVGGLAVNALPHLADELRADEQCADARSVFDFARSMRR